MADTLKFGPEWLRALSDGNSVGTPPPSPAVPFGKYKLADYRYGREEMLALFNPNSEVPDDLHAVSSILVEKAQEPMCLLPLSEEEQRIMSQSVNSVAVLRMMGRGAPPLRGGRGSGMERGRGRGRGRGEGYMQRGMSYDETDTGGFGRGRSLSRPDGWEEAGAKRFERTFQSRYDDTGNPQKVFQRSQSNDNWRVREDEDEEDDGDWRRAGGSKWSSRGSWRDRGRDGGFEFDRSGQSNLNRNQGGFSRQYQRSRSSESWDDEDLPEWIVPDHGDGEELGTFDASGAFVSNKKKEEGGTSEEVAEERFAAPPPDEPISVKKEHKPEKTSGKNQVESNSKDTDDNKPEKSNSNQMPNKNLSPRPSDTRENSTNKSNNSQSNNKTKLKSSASEKETSKISSKEEALHTLAEKNISNSAFANDLVTEKTPSRNLSPPDLKSKKEEDIKSKSEADALKKLKETAENMVADMTVEDEKEKALLSTDPMRGALPPDHENSLKWLYRDPQGDLQGPFTANEMAEWFSAGYFTMNLLVKRGIDEKFSPLGELIKRWGRVPFLPGPTPPPLLNSPQLSPDISQQQQQQRECEREQEEQALQVLQQHMMIQQQIMQQQLIRQTLTQPWLHLQQIQGLIHQLQENEQFKSLPPLQQQQIAIQMLLKQPPPLLFPAQQQSHSPQQKLSPRTPPSEAAAGALHPSFHRSLSNPGETTSHSHAEEATMKGLSQPTSIWDIDAKSQLQPSELEAHLKKLQREQEEAERRKKLQEEERKRQAEIERKHQELKKEQEEIQRRKEAMEKELQELERKKQMELQRIEEEKKKAEERQRIEEERRKQEELHRKEEEDRKRREEEERRQREEVERRQQELQQQKQQQELKRQQELKQQEILRQQELRRQKEQEELEKQKQAEIQHRQELRQQEAMRKLQQEQLTNMQLPAHAQWASSPSSINPGIPQKTMAEIEQEERERQEIEEQKKKKQMEMQRQQSLLYQQQQQQQQKSWSTPVKAPVVASTRSLLEIQEEQARQFEVEKTSRDQQQQQVTKNMTISSASVWSGVAPSNWASEGAWGNALRASKGEPDSGDSMGFWDEAIISSSGPLPKKQSGNKNSGNKGSADFPALGAILGQNRTLNTIKSKPVKSNKDEEAAQRLFQAHKPADDFTRWCENTLRNMATSVDIPTFIAFLQEVESPYEVHDYVKSYLGETKVAHDFAKQFLEKRSQYKNKSKPVTQEDSIWGPAPAVNPHEHRQQHTSNTAIDNNDEQKGKGKKKKKMTKIDNSILGFTVHAAPDRFNVGELDTIDGK